MLKNHRQITQDARFSCDRVAYYRLSISEGTLATVASTPTASRDLPDQENSPIRLQISRAATMDGRGHVMTDGMGWVVQARAGTSSVWSHPMQITLRAL